MSCHIYIYIYVIPVNNVLCYSNQCLHQQMCTHTHTHTHTHMCTRTDMHTGDAWIGKRKLKDHKLAKFIFKPISVTWREVSGCRQLFADVLKKRITHPQFWYTSRPRAHPSTVFLLFMPLHLSLQPPPASRPPSLILHVTSTLELKAQLWTSGNVIHNDLYQLGIFLLQFSPFNNFAYIHVCVCMCVCVCVCVWTCRFPYI